MCVVFGYNKWCEKNVKLCKNRSKTLAFRGAEHGVSGLRADQESSL